MKKIKYEKYFLLSWKRILIIVVSWFLAVLLHNLIYGLGVYFFGEDVWGVGGDEPVFFIIATILIPVYFVISVGYTFYRNLRN
jgi:hypothetical protein